MSEKRGMLDLSRRKFLKGAVASVGVIGAGVGASAFVAGRAGGAIVWDGPLAAPAPGAAHYTVAAPNGADPTENDLASHRYRHHTAVAEHRSRVWVANSSGGTNEDASGQMTVVAHSPTDAIAFSAPLQAVPPQSAFSAAGASYTDGTRVTYPRCFVKHGGKLYLVAAVEGISGGKTVGLALVARECRDDGTLGPIFRISTGAYAPLNGIAAINYDAALGPPIYARADLYGIWGGSHPDNTPAAWNMYTTQGAAMYAEPATIDASGDGSCLIRLWRRLTAPDTYVWVQHSKDGGATWSPLRQTDIPNAPSAVSGARLPNGKIAVAGNKDASRDPLYLALFDDDGLERGRLFYVRQGVRTTPTYPGEYKGGGAAYPGVWVGSADLWVSYSIAKETIGVTRIPLSRIS